MAARTCPRGAAVTLNGAPAARRLFADPSGRRLPSWEGCLRLQQGSYLLLMNRRPDSFDGRYFGPTQERDILGKAVPLWLPGEGR
jgi:type IV secretory pathway protease TraF